MKEREKFSSRLGFLLISAGCAIGLGNVYRFPIMVGSYGGAFFVLIYILFLLLLGLPIMTMELSVGRASQRSIASSFDVLQKPNHRHRAECHQHRQHHRQHSPELIHRFPHIFHCISESCPHRFGLPRRE